MNGHTYAFTFLINFSYFSTLFSEVFILIADTAEPILNHSGCGFFQLPETRSSKFLVFVTYNVMIIPDCRGGLFLE